MQTTATNVTRSVIYDEFLAFQEFTYLVGYTGARQAEFKTSQVHDPDQVRDTYRRSQVLLDTGQFHTLFAQRIAFYLPRILRALQHPFFEMTRMESQITASNDGDYFRVHNDSTHANWPSREITFVYFFHREPCPFTGGELVLYDFSADGDAPSVNGRQSIRHRVCCVLTERTSNLPIYQS